MRPIFGFLLIFAVGFALVIIGVFNQNDIGVFLPTYGAIGIISASVYVWFNLQSQTKKLERQEEVEQEKRERIPVISREIREEEPIAA